MNIRLQGFLCKMSPKLCKKLRILGTSNRFRTDYRGVRPYGVSLLLAGYTENPPHDQNPYSLYQIDPSGTQLGSLSYLRLLFPLACNGHRAKFLFRQTISRKTVQS